MFYIKKITLITGQDVHSSIDLEPGLNIIYGESNTGKSLVLDSIDYLLGAEEHRYDAKLEVKRVILTLDVDGSSLTLARNVDSTEIEMSSQVNGIASDTYKLKGNKGINSVWLKLMGIEDGTQIFMTLEGKTQKFSVRTFYHTFLLDETRVQGTASILAAGSGVNKKVATSALTSLLFMATGNNYLPDEKKDDKKTRKIKRDAVKAFVDRSMSALEAKKISELQDPLKEPPAELQKKVDSVIDEIAAAEGTLSYALDKSRELADRIIVIENQLTESLMLKNRNASLLTQYTSDIRRLTFIVEGDIHGEAVSALEVCPFCNGQLSKKQSESCIDTAVAEVQKIEAQVKDLLSVQDAIDREIENLQEERSAIIKERQKVDAVIRGELRPQIATLRALLAEYTMTLNQYKAKEMIDAFSDVLIKELEVTEEETADGFTFDVWAKIQEVLLIKLDEQLKILLRSCNYQNFTGVWFDLDDYDVVVNSHKKKTQGQGFRAFLNTLVAMAFRNVLEEYGHYQYPVMVIDSPILSLKEKDDNPGGERTSDTMKSGLFKYFVEHQKGPQLIVIENRIPDIDYTGVNLLEFTKDEARGRYGLIDGYRE